MVYSTEHWGSFFDSFTATLAGVDTKAWADFFEIFSASPDFSRIADEGPPARQDINEWAKFLILFDAEYSKMRGRGECIDVWEVSAIRDKELPNSAVLAWLLNCNGSHGQNDAFLKALLESAGSVDIPNFPRICDVPPSYQTLTEYSHGEAQEETDGRRYSRVDIEVRAPGFSLLIEVKVNAAETGDQLARYSKSVEDLPCVRGVLFVTPSGKRPGDEGLHSKVAAVSWKTLARAFARQAGKMPQHSFGAMAIQQFCEHISRF